MDRNQRAKGNLVEMLIAGQNPEVREALPSSRGMWYAVSAYSSLSIKFRYLTSVLAPPWIWMPILPVCGIAGSASV